MAGVEPAFPNFSLASSLLNHIEVQKYSALQTVFWRHMAYYLRLKILYPKQAARN